MNGCISRYSPLNAISGKNRLISTTLSPIVLEAWSAASLTQYSFVATIVSILMGVVGFFSLQRLAYSTKWFARSPCRQWNVISLAPAGGAAAGFAASAAGLAASAGLGAGAAGGGPPGLGPTG